MDGFLAIHDGVQQSCYCIGIRGGRVWQHQHYAEFRLHYPEQVDYAELDLASLLAVLGKLFQRYSMAAGDYWNRQRSCNPSPRHGYLYCAAGPPSLRFLAPGSQRQQRLLLWHGRDNGRLLSVADLASERFKELLQLHWRPD